MQALVSNIPETQRHVTHVVVLSDLYYTYVCCGVVCCTARCDWCTVRCCIVLQLCCCVVLVFF